MGQALYRKYRSKSLDEIVGQDHITKTLGNALKTGKISHAYLLTGPRGVGKTSVARILAHVVNKLPYTDGSAHLDIIEIDAASNRRIDEVRDLRDKVHITPTSATYKVYIIDEVHMLTREAFNALLKTLEEPPAHVIFILATTEAYKLPETIISRTQRFSFKPIEPTIIKKHLKTIAKKEGIHVDDDALALIAEQSEGSFRDSISLLDQASTAGQRISAAEVQRQLGIAPQAALDQLISALEQGSAQALVATLQQLREQGYQASQLAKQISARLRAQMLESGAPAADYTLTLLRKLLDVPASQNSEQLLELVLLEAVYSRQSTEQPATASSPKTAASTKSARAKATKPATGSAAKVTLKASASKAADSSTATTAFALEQWPEVLSLIKQRYNTLYGVLRMSQPRLDGQTLVLAFRFPFHQKRVSDGKNRQIITDTITQIGSQPPKLECIIDETIEVGPPTAADTAAQDTVMDTISNIFGGAELLES